MLEMVELWRVRQQGQGTVRSHRGRMGAVEVRSEGDTCQM